MTKYLNKLRQHYNNYDYPVFTLTDIRIFLSNDGVSQRYLKIMLNNLIKKKEIIRIAKGVYTFHKDAAVVGFAFRPFYYGLEDALSYRNLWTQNANPTVLTTKNVREGTRKFVESNYTVKRVAPELFFGFDFIKYYEMWLPVSDPEKTLIDLVYYHHGIRDDALEKLSGSLDLQKLEGYLKAYSDNFKRKIHKIISTRPTQNRNG
ncbi:MAG: hypothetical protein M1569_01710 [Candidatus Marsarchaeota archaeon]|nr:hypothetical protein [Candidatus Marsarchaeota archaeon]MCL5413098.1 hypothetical protein [Candidatus Marsarchaeota archaeon]